MHRNSFSTTSKLTSRRAIKSWPPLVTNDLPRFLIVIAVAMLRSLPLAVVTGPSAGSRGMRVDPPAEEGQRPQRSRDAAGWAHRSELRCRSPVKNMTLDLLENSQLDEEHHKSKEKRPRENLGHVEKLEPVMKLEADP